MKFQFVIFLLGGLIFSTSQANQPLADIYIFIGGQSVCGFNSYLNNPSIKGAQIVYSWKKLEPVENKYDFNQIYKDLQCVKLKRKKLFIQIQDRSFTPNNIPVPSYILKDPKYNGGVAQQIDNPGQGKPKTVGWVAKQWQPAVRNRFQKLLIELGRQFDGKIDGINLPETSIDIVSKQKTAQFCTLYFDSILDNMNTLKKSFKKSAVVQYVNFIPCEWSNSKGYMEKLFKYALSIGVGIGNPDTVPFKKSQMENSYSFLHSYHHSLAIVAVAVQEPDYIYTNPQTSRNFTIAELYHFNKNYLGSTIIFWNIQEPQFTEKLIPFLEKTNSG